MKPEHIPPLTPHARRVLDDFVAIAEMAEGRLPATYYCAVWYGIARGLPEPMAFAVAEALSIHEAHIARAEAGQPTIAEKVSQLEAELAAQRPKQWKPQCPRCGLWHENGPRACVVRSEQVKGIVAHEHAPQAAKSFTLPELDGALGITPEQFLGMINGTKKEP